MVYNHLNQYIVIILFILIISVFIIVRFGFFNCNINKLVLIINP